MKRYKSKKKKKKKGLSYVLEKDCRGSMEVVRSALRMMSVVDEWLISTVIA